MNIIIFSKGAGNQQYGLGVDAKLLMNTLKDIVKNANIKHCDPYTFVGKGKMPQVSDLHIYLEIPCRVAFPWAKLNIVIPNQEWWYIQDFNTDTQLLLHGCFFCCRDKQSTPKSEFGY